MLSMPRLRVSLLLSCVVPLLLASACEPRACEPADASTRVDLVVDLGGYEPAGATPDGYRFDDMPCTVTAVDTSDATTVRTELECTEGASTHALAIEHASSDLGDPAWAAGDSLSLSIELRVYSDLNDIPLLAVALQSPEGEPRLLAMDNDEITSTVAAPLELSLDADACPDPNTSEQTRGVLAVTLDGVTTKVVDANDGTLETSTGTFAVELAQAVSGDFGERSLNFELLVMKVQ